MMMKPSHLIPQPFPALPPDLPPHLQKMVSALERKLVGSMQARVFVTIEAGEHLDLFLVCMERLLRFTQSKHLLNPKQAVIEWFEGTLIEENEGDTTQPGAIHWPIPL
jgi:hypothetical protein